MAKEKQFENKIKKFLDTLPNIWYFKHWAGMYPRRAYLIYYVVSTEGSWV